MLSMARLSRSTGKVTIGRVTKLEQKKRRKNIGPLRFLESHVRLLLNLEDTLFVFLGLGFRGGLLSLLRLEKE